MKNRKGFTLIELLVVVVIIGILLMIAVPAVTGYLKRGTKEYYTSLEDTVMLSGRDYLNDYRALLPREINNVRVIELKELVDNKYIKNVVDSNGKECTARVTAKKTGKNEYEYYSCLVCEDYQTEGEACEFDENNNITAETKYYRVEVEKDSYVVEQGESFELPYAKVYYTKNGIEELVSDRVVGNPKTIDTNKLGTTTVAYVYKGARKEITVKVIDVVSPSIPQVVLRKSNKSGKVYTGGWYSGNIYEEFKSTDYSKPGILGSGIKEYQLSEDGKSYSTLTSNYHISIKNGEQTYYIRSVDKSGNISKSNTYSLKIDQEIPQCTLKSSGTLGNSPWYTSDAKIEFSSKKEEVSSIKSEKIDSPNITGDVKNKKITGTVIDQAGNEGKCYTTVSVDKTNPTVSYNVAGGIYNSNKTVTVTGSDTYFSYMNIETKKNGSIINSDSNITSKTKKYTLTHGSWVISTTAYDESGRNGSKSINYTIDTKLPTCGLKVTSGTTGNSPWYSSDVTVDFSSTDGTGTNISTSSIDKSSVTSEGRTTVTGTVTDQARNEGKCYTTVSVDKTNPTVSYSLAEGVYNSNKTVTVTGSDTYFSYMNIHVYKNGTISNADNSLTSKTKSYTLTDGNWTVYTQAYDQSGRRQSQSPENESGWYYQNYTIDTQAPSCSLKVTGGTVGNNGWYTSDVTVGFNTTDGTGSNIIASNISQTSVTSEGTTTVTGTVTDQAGNVGTCSIPVSIDKTNPTVSSNLASGTYTTNQTVTYTARDNESGIQAIQYEVYLNGSQQDANYYLQSTTASFNLEAGTWDIYIKTLDQSGNWDNGGEWSHYTYAINTCSYAIGQIWEFNYTGGTQSFTVPCSGTYKLEVWGAQGGSPSYSNCGTISAGGKGGYSSGNLSINKDSELYIVVGGAGNANATGCKNYDEVEEICDLYYPVKGGYNGGGNAEPHSGPNQYGSGGGATHIGTFNSTLAGHGSTSGLYIVAGGGGGGHLMDAWDYQENENIHLMSDGGAGGGSSGVNGNSFNDEYDDSDDLTCIGQGAAGGTQDVGHGFGQGGDGVSSGPGGGGGYYGGFKGSFGKGGGGGSGYIDGVTGGSMQNGVRSGNGYARITLVSIDN